jgi:hypothetical protein
MSTQTRLEQNQRIVDEFRANDGRVGGPFAGAPLLLLTTRGAKSGRDVVSPAMTTEDGDRLLIYGTAAAGPTTPPGITTSSQTRT